EALPRILDYLKTRGDSIVSISTLLGTTRDSLMPSTETKPRTLTYFVSGAGFRIFHAAEEFLWAFMIVATALVVLRTLIVIWLAARFRRTWPRDFAQPISVIVAAFNEEKVIAATLRNLLATDYEGEVEVIVVDDGSADRTAAEVETVAHSDPRVRLFRQPNRGKAAALQRGLDAMRKSAIEDVGGLSLETLAEDTDLTLALHKRGHRIVYVPEAIAWTEAPETVKTLARQRFRWAYGTLQCLWKHRDMVFNWKYRA